MVKQKQQGPTTGMRLTADEKYLLTAYGAVIGKRKGTVIHDLIKAAVPHMAAVIVRAEIEKDLADPHAADWTPTLPDAALDKAKRERKAAQKG